MRSAGKKKAASGENRIKFRFTRESHDLGKKMENPGEKINSRPTELAIHVNYYVTSQMLSGKSKSPCVSKGLTCTKCSSFRLETDKMSKN